MAVSMRHGLTGAEVGCRTRHSRIPPNGPVECLRLDGEKFEGLLEAYYELRGWDWRGVPTRARLE